MQLHSKFGLLARFFHISETTRTTFIKSLHIIFIMYIIRSETFIEIDSLQHLKISIQTFPMSLSKICVTTFIHCIHSFICRISYFLRLLYAKHQTLSSWASVGFSVAGLNRTKFGFYHFQSFLFIVVIVISILLKPSFWQISLYSQSLVTETF